MYGEINLIDYESFKNQFINSNLIMSTLDNRITFDKKLNKFEICNIQTGVIKLCDNFTESFLLFKGEGVK